MYVKNVGLTVDASSTIYVYASGSQVLFYKLNSALTVLQSKILKNTGPSNGLFGVNLLNYNNANIFLVMGGQWYSSTDK